MLGLQIPCLATSMGYPLCVCQVPLTSPQLLLCLLAFIDISNQGVPANAAARLVPQRKSTRLAPSVHSNRAPKAMLRVVWLSGLECVNPQIHRPKKVVQMNGIIRPLLSSLLKSFAKVFQNSARKRNHRNSLSLRRKWPLVSNGRTNSRAFLKSSSMWGRSSGWTATFHSQPSARSADRPVYFSHLKLKKSADQSGRADHTKVGKASMI